MFSFSVFSYILENASKKIFLGI